MDVLRTCSINNLTSEPYHQNLNLVECNCTTMKLGSHIAMNESNTSSNYWLLSNIYLLNHIVYSKSPKILDHRLTTDKGDCGSPTGNSEGSHPKILSTIRVPNGFFRSGSDQDPSAVKPMFEFDPYDKSYDKFSHHQKRMASGSLRKVAEL